MGPQTDAKFKKESQGNCEKQGIQHKSVQMTGEKQRQMGPASLTSKVATSQPAKARPRAPAQPPRHALCPECPLPLTQARPPPSMNPGTLLPPTGFHSGPWDGLTPLPAGPLGV